MLRRAPIASPHPAARLVPAAACVIALVVAASLVARDASARRAAASNTRTVKRSAAEVVGPELSLHSASRWLRHPTRVEPWAAGQDGPAMLDLDPGAAMAPPPVDVVRAGWPTIAMRLVRRGR